MDLRLGHCRPDPRCLWVQDASHLRRHLTARVRVGSNTAQDFDTHAQKEHGAEWRC
jgi:hypothetical protein